MAVAIRVQSQESGVHDNRHQPTRQPPRHAAVVQGALTPRDSGRLRSRQLADGVTKPSVTHYSVIASSGGLSLVRLTPVTGRRRQLRAHCGELLRAPIVGDYK